MPCVKYCESKNDKHLCGVLSRKENKIMIEDEKILTRQLLDGYIDQWGKDRGITTNGTPMGQFKKTLEEVAELGQGLKDDNMEEIMDGIGDVYVTLRMLCGTLDITMERCIYLAYQDIKDRTGYLNEEGIFVKDVTPITTSDRNNTPDERRTDKRRRRRRGEK